MTRKNGGGGILDLVSSQTSAYRIDRAITARPQFDIFPLWPHYRLLSSYKKSISFAVDRTRNVIQMFLNTLKKEKSSMSS